MTVTSGSAYKRRTALFFIRRLRDGRVSLLTCVQACVLSCVLGVALYHGVHVGYQKPSALYVRALNVLFPAGKSCAIPHDRSDGGDCAALGGMRRPSWACYSDMLYALPKFVELYHRRPLVQNKGGMRMEHSFALYYMLRKIRPTAVIESGAYKGHGTWIIRNAAPTARIFSIDPAEPARRLPGVTYLVGRNFTDFKNVDWKKYDIDIDTTVVFIDDHQNSFKRMFRDNSYGLRHFIIEDNFPYQLGDSQSLKSVCEVREFRRKEWRGFIRDDFHRKTEKMSWAQHLAEGETLKRRLKVYYEFPPIVDEEIGPEKTWHSDKRYASKPIVKDRVTMKKIFKGVDKWEFADYIHIAYAEIGV